MRGNVMTPCEFWRFLQSGEIRQRGLEAVCTSIRDVCKAEKINIGNTSFLDSGSGGGKVTLHAAASLGVKEAHGVEYFEHRVKLADMLLKEVVNDLGGTINYLLIPI